MVFFVQNCNWKRCASFLFFFFTATSALFSAPIREQLQPKLLQKTTLQRGTSPEFKVGLFRANSVTFRQIYPDLVWMQGGEWNVPFASYGNVWASVEYLKCKGRALNGGTKTKFRYIPVSTGLSIEIPLEERVLVYSLGVGVLGGHTRVQNFSRYVQDQSVFHIGGIFKTSVSFQFFRSAFLRFFNEYTIFKVPYKNKFPGVVDRRGDMSGFMFGTSLRYEIPPKSQKRPVYETQKKTKSSRRWSIF